MITFRLQASPTVWHTYL